MHDHHAEREHSGTDWKKSTTGLGPHGHVYKDLRVIEATRRQIEKNPLWRIPDMNRELVEESTHPIRLAKIVEEAPKIWTSHHNAMEGEASADRMAAKNVLVKWHEPFYDPGSNDNGEVLFKTNDAMTRLADPSIDIEFPKGTIGPFGKEISKISIPYRMIEGQAAALADLRDATAEIAESNGDGIRFRVPTGKEFGYDRHGLREMKTE